jgi:hypothetical protein
MEARIGRAAPLRHLGVFALLLSLACENPAGVPFPAQATPMVPPEMYRAWWTLTEECSGSRGDFAAIRWYVIPGETFFPGHPGVNAVYYSGSRRTVVTERAMYDGQVIRHEMLHALTGLEHGRHPRQQFRVNCAGIVACDDDCVSDGGAAPAAIAEARRVGPASITVTVSTWPPPATRRGYLSVVVSATNESSTPVVVDLPRDAGSAPRSFEAALHGNGSQVWRASRARSPESTYFAPGETKRYFFDFRVAAEAGPHVLLPGSWTFNGAYGNRWGPAPDRLTAVP